MSQEIVQNLQIRCVGSPQLTLEIVEVYSWNQQEYLWNHVEG